MIRCETMQDRIPELAQSRLAPTVEEAAHLASCADCRAELQLVEQAVAFGTGDLLNQHQIERWLMAELRKPSPQRLAEKSRIPWRWRAPILVGLAAALALVVWSPRRNSGIPIGTDEVVAGGIFPELLNLSTDQLHTVLESWRSEDPEYLQGGMPALENLDAAQLQRVLQQIEGGS